MTRRSWPRGRTRSVALAATLLATSAASIPSSVAAAVPDAGQVSVKVVLTVDPGTSSVEFRYGGSLGQFRLGADAEAPSQTFDVDAGTVRVRQQTFKLWPLQSASCVDTDDVDVPATVKLDRGLVVVDTGPGDVITCTFTNARASVINTRAGHDADRSGTLDPSEAWLADSTMELFDDTDELVKTHTTNDAGRTRFMVAAGTYTVCNRLPEGWTGTRSSDVAEAGRLCKQINVGAGQQSWQRFLAAPAEMQPVPERRLALGYKVSCGIRLDQTAGCWGGGWSETLEVPDGQFHQLAVGDFIACGLRPTGAAECWGRDAVVPPTGTFVQIAASAARVCGLRPDGSAACWGPGHDDSNTPPDTTFTQIDVGTSDSCGLDTAGEIQCWRNLRSPKPAGQFASFDIGGAHMCGVGLDGSVTCEWKFTGYDDPDGTFTKVAAGNWHACGLRESGKIDCWGTNRQGALDAPAGTFVDIVSGGRSDHSCAERSDGHVECWGSDSYGQTVPPGETFVDVFSDGGVTCGLSGTDEGTCWGAYLPLRPELPRTPVGSMAFAWLTACWLDDDGIAVCTDQPNENGPIQSPPGEIAALTAGYDHYCGLRPTGRVRCWGRNQFKKSEPPSGSFQSVVAGWDHTCGIKDDGTVSCWGRNAETALPPQGQFVSISAGHDHTCGLRSDGTVECWALDPDVDFVDFPGTYTSLASGGLGFFRLGFTCGLGVDGIVSCFSSAGRAGGDWSAPDEPFVALAGNWTSMCGLRDDGSLRCWGKGPRDAAFQQSRSGAWSAATGR